MAAYVGNSAHSYAGSTAMLLASIGESVEPTKIEVLSGIGLGASWVSRVNMILFSALRFAPDRGISKALDLLGFSYSEKCREHDFKAPWDELRADLGRSPVVLGPLNRSDLRYNPTHEHLYGADHYVLAYAMDEEEAHLHDPAGFPHVSLSLADLEHAWRAEPITYRRGAFRSWSAPMRVSNPSESEIYAGALVHFRSLYETSAQIAANVGNLVGQEAILELAKRLEIGEQTQQELGHLVHFAFQVSARRALAYAGFFEARDPELAKLKRLQAQQFGRCHTLVVAKRGAELVDVVRELAQVEAAFEQALLRR